VYQAKVKPLNTLQFGLGFCGRDEIAKAKTLKAKGAAESFWLLFAEKSKANARHKGRKDCEADKNIISQ
jgi:hypothetical protein